MPARKTMGGARKVLIGITGGIAAYKIPALVRLLRKNGCEVKTVLTNAAKTLVGADALRTLSGNPVYTDGEYRYDMDHIRLAEWADVFAVCPATANTIAKIACGIADNLLTSLALSIPEEKIIVAPAMNSVMWENKATQANINTLKGRGVTVLPVDEGELACGVSGAGRMVEIETIMLAISQSQSQSQNQNQNQSQRHIIRGEVSPSLQPKFGQKDVRISFSATPSAGGHPPQRPPSAFAGKNVLISSGPTEESIDPVRVITNKSSGKMGAALARAALDMGAKVTVVTGPAVEPLPDGVDVVPIRTAAEMERAMASRFAEADVCIMAAAVSDYRPVNASAYKIHRSDNENITLELTPNPDILAGLGAAKSRQFLVGFSLESGDGDIDRAEDKMKRKKCDMMVFNKADVSLGGDGTRVTLLFDGGEKKDLTMMSKIDAAQIILQNIADRRGWTT